MNESIHRYFRIGALQWMSYPKERALDSLYRVAADPYFDAVEFNGCERREDRAQAKKIIAESHICAAIGAQPRLLAGKLNPNALVEAEREKAEKAILEAADEAAEIGAEGLSFLSGRYTPETKEACFAALVTTTRNVCRHAQKLGLQVELELFDYNVDKCSLMGPVDEAARFAAEIRKDCPNFGLLLDLSHLPIMHEETEYAVRTLRPYLTHFHIGNAVMKPGAPSYGDKHPRFGFPDSENDTAELVRFFRALRDEGFFNAERPYMLSTEITPQGDEDPLLVMAGAKRVINRAWAMV